MTGCDRAMTRDQIIEETEEDIKNNIFGIGSKAVEKLRSLPADATEEEIIAHMEAYVGWISRWAYRHERHLDELAKIIIKDGNPLWAFRWGRNIKTHKDDMAQVIIDANDAYHAYWWAKDVGTHREAMADVVIKAREAKWSYFWAKEVGSRKDEMAKVVLEAGNAEDACLWAKNIGTHMDAMAAIVIKSCDPLPGGRISGARTSVKLKNS